MTNDRNIKISTPFGWWLSDRLVLVKIDKDNDCRKENSPTNKILYIKKKKMCIYFLFWLHPSCWESWEPVPNPCLHQNDIFKGIENSKDKTLFGSLSQYEHHMHHGLLFLSHLFASAFSQWCTQVTKPLFMLSLT